MDYADEDAVKSFECWEAALLALQWIGGSELDPDCAIATAAGSLVGHSSIVQMKREAVINAARIEGSAHLARMQKAFPNLQLAPLVQALRVKYVELRLEER